MVEHDWGGGGGGRGETPEKQSEQADTMQEVATFKGFQGESTQHF